MCGADERITQAGMGLEISKVGLFKLDTGTLSAPMIRTLNEYSSVVSSYSMYVKAWACTL